MSFLTEQQRTEMLANGAARARGEAVDPFPVVKLHTLDAHATWLLSELASDEDTAYGLVDVGLGMPELAHARLSDLASIRGPNGIPVRVDPSFRPRQSLAAYAADSVRDGAIND
jgi:hypothetical protein